MEIKTYRDLEVWQESMDLAVDCYRLTHSLPDHEKYGLISQIQRSAASIPANLAEGHARRQTKVFINSINIAFGSLAELETHLSLILRLKFINAEKLNPFFEKTKKIGKMLSGLHKSLKRRI